MDGFPPIEDGTLLVYRQFDVAEDIDLARAEARLAGAGERLRLRAERVGFLDLPDPPLSVAIGSRTIAPAGRAPVPAEAHVRLFAHGVASVRYEIPLPAGCDAAAAAALVHAFADAPAVEAAARAEAEAVCGRLGDALAGPLRSPLFETYTVVFARRLRGGPPAAAANADLARVLLGEPPGAALSDQTVEDVTRRSLSYLRDDLCVVDWDSAYVVEPGGDRAVADVLELATAQLLEFRHYDALFEEELLRVTELLGRPRMAWAWLFVGRYGEITRRVQNLVVESTEVIERTENAVRVVGDLYLARVYRAAVERFRVTVWEQSVVRRREAAAQVASLLRSEANAALGHVLEATIVALIVLEIAMALARP